MTTYERPQDFWHQLSWLIWVEKEVLATDFEARQPELSDYIQHSVRVADRDGETARVVCGVGDVALFKRDRMGDTAIYFRLTNTRTPTTLGSPRGGVYTDLRHADLLIEKHPRGLFVVGPRKP